MQILKIHGDNAIYLGYGDSEDNHEGEFGFESAECITIEIVDEDTDEVLKTLTVDDLDEDVLEDSVEESASAAYVTFHCGFEADHEAYEEEIDPSKIGMYWCDYKLPDGDTLSMLQFNYDSGMMEVSEGGDYDETTWIDGEEQW